MSDWLWASFLLSVRGLAFDWLPTLQFVANLGVAIGTILLAVKTAHMADKAAETADIAGKQLRAQIVREEEERRPRVYFRSIYVEKQPRVRDGETAVIFQAFGLTNLATHAIVVEKVALLSVTEYVFCRGLTLAVIVAGESWSSDTGGFDGMLSFTRPFPATDEYVDQMFREAAFVDLYFRSGSDSRRIWKLRFIRDADPLGRWMSFSGGFTTAEEVSIEDAAT